MLPRRFALVRHVDYTGISGLGVVAYGVVFTDGHVALRWTSDHPATSLWNSVDDLLAVHGHGDATSIEWLDPASDVLDQAPPRGRRARRSGPIVPVSEDHHSGPEAQRPATEARTSGPADDIGPPPAPPPGPHVPAGTQHAHASLRVPSQRGTGRHRRASTEQESRPTAPIESDWT